MMLFLPIITIFFGASLAQRPNNVSTCDYYAESLYGTNSNVTQLRLMQSIVTLAFAGPFTLKNVTPGLTGIWNPGSYNGLGVNLRPWFNGSLASTNNGNEAIAVNWLDAGLEPLSDFLTGVSPTLELANGTNQFKLFQEWFSAFGHIFDCTETSAPATSSSSGQQLSVAYTHKFMNLNYTDIAYFIDQLSLATQYYGFSQEDATTLSNNLNSQYNVACAPPITLNPAQGPELLSICQASNCPLAEPSADCALYQNLQPGGLSSSTAKPTSSPGPSGASLPSAGATMSMSSSHKLSDGAIAGIVIGAIIAALLAVGMILYFRRKRQLQQQQQPPTQEQFTPASAHAAPPYTDNNHASYTSTAEGWNGSTVAEMESPRGFNDYNPSPPMQEAAGFSGYPHHIGELAGDETTRKKVDT